MSENNRSRRGGIVGPLILIALGAVLLLNNLGMLDWSVWDILLRLWPVILIATGLDLILGRRSVWGALLAVLLTAVIVALALWLSQSGMTAGRAARTVEVAQPLEDLERAEMIIDPGIGRLELGPLVDSSNLAEAVLALGRGETLDRTFSSGNDGAALTLRTTSTSFGPFSAGWANQRRWEVKLSPQVTFDLNTNVGLGTTDLDLGGLTVDRLSVEHGIGQVVVTLPREGRVRGSIQGAIGQTVVVIPEDVEARLVLDTGLAGRQVPEDYECEDDVCTSPGYAGADQPLDLEVGQAIGHLVIRH